MTYTLQQSIDAMCIWEELIALNASDTKAADWSELYEEHGTAQMREFSLTIYEPFITAVVKICVQADEFIFDAKPYDWEVIPAALDLCRDAEGKPTLDVENINKQNMAQNLIAALKA